MILRYQEERSLDPWDDDDLFDTIRSYDEHFTYAGIPTDRIEDVYLEAMRVHGQYLLKVNDHLNAWERIRPRGEAPRDMRPMSQRGADCPICHGKGMTTKFIPRSFANPEAGGDEIEQGCPFHCEVVTAIERR